METLIFLICILQICLKFLRSCRIYTLYSTSSFKMEQLIENDTPKNFENGEVGEQDSGVSS